jgi:uncharacterized protein
VNDPTPLPPAGESGGQAPERPFDHDPAGHTRTGARRLIELDVTRAVALIGVVVMNYHGYLNRGVDGVDISWAERLFNPWEGVLSTRFAATFVLVAGMGITLLTRRSRASGDRSAIHADRIRLVRRGVVLFAGGWVLDHHWPGTIILYYGAFFVIAAALFTLRTRWLVMVGATVAIASAAINQWAQWRILDGHDMRWLDPDSNSPRDLVFTTLTGGTHPVLPWLTFLCAGMVIGRLLPRLNDLRLLLFGGGLLALGLTYVVNSLGPPSSADMIRGSSRADVLWANLLSTQPFDRGLLYTINALGSAVAAFCIISWLTQRWPTATPTVVLQRAGQMTLSIYLAHVIVFKLFVEWTTSITPTGLDAALWFAFGFWVVAVVVAAWWHKMFGAGPLERLYRWLGG